MERDTILDVLDRLNSPSHGGPSSQLQLAAMHDTLDKSNAVPNVDFDSLQQADVTSLQHTLDQLERDEQSIIGLARRIERRRKLGREYFNRATAALAPVNRLPAETLARIFVLGKHLELNFALRMSWVAQRWRSVALSTPELWNVLPLTGQHRVAAYLDRSGSTLLDIQADLRTYRVNIHEIAQCMKLLEPHRLRWRSVKVLLEDHDQSQSILRQLEGICTDAQRHLRPSALQSIYFGIAGPHHHQISRHYSSALAISALPNLRVIELLGIDLLCSPASTNFGKLERLSLGGIDNMHLKSHFFHALSTMPDLAELVLDQCNFVLPTLIDNGPPIDLERLSVLQLSLIPDEVTNLIVKKLHTPSLQRFELISQELAGPSQLLDWDAFRRTYRNLSVLKLTSITSYATSFVLKWLKELPQLTSLSVLFQEHLSPHNADKSSEKVVRELVNTRNQLCPQLQALEIGTLAPSGVALLRTLVNTRPKLQSGKLSVILQSGPKDPQDQNKNLAWMKVHSRKLKIRVQGDESDDESTDEEQ